ncbi:uncharacterized protein LOC126783456 [Argentina anserina]|uniref:uncharacterized protein LOC126783456 n=1 Tax=Argentina anserina TaxID=57926 RepID=UPI00217675B0|nr:uncharacterized protein LOC126783456 [Potentilla anserina]
MLDPQTNDHPFLFIPEKTSDATYDTWQPVNYSSGAQRTARNYKSWKSMGALRLNAAEEESPSDVFSPPLWKTTTTRPPRSPNRAVSNYRNLSPASRTQAISRGQREMMEMVRNMPESCYELSLKDLVERPTMVEVEVDEDTVGLVKRADGRVKNKSERKKPMVMRSGSMDSGGFLLKMVFPISLGSNKKNDKMTMINKNKKKRSDYVEGDSSTSEKVSARPCVDKDWWKKRVSASGESGRSESSASSIISGSIKSSSGSSSCCSRSSSRRKTNGCWSFIVLKKKRQD